MRADLHLHTCYSDGTESPAAAVAAAQAAGLNLIAIADHDSLGGVEEACAAARPGGLEVIPAAEFTASLHGREIHLLGYFADIPDEPLRRYLRRMQDFRRQRMETALARLRQRGVEVDSSDLPRAVCCESLTTTHLAVLLVARGYAASVGAAWRRYLASERGIVPLFEVTAEEVIAVIHCGGGLAVWAHPNRRHLQRELDELVAQGLDGIEVLNKRRRLEAVEGLRTLVQKYNLVATGGSDWHGEGPLGAHVADGALLHDFLRRISIGNRSMSAGYH